MVLTQFFKLRNVRTTNYQGSAARDHLKSCGGVKKRRHHVPVYITSVLKDDTSHLVSNKLEGE